VLVPHLIVVPDLCDRERAGLSLLFFGQPSVCCLRELQDGEERTEDFPALAETLVVNRIDDVDNSGAVVIVFLARWILRWPPRSQNWIGPKAKIYFQLRE
jgi:hypothetical protein